VFRKLLREDAQGSVVWCAVIESKANRLPEQNGRRVVFLKLAMSFASRDGMAWSRHNGTSSEKIFQRSLMQCLLHISSGCVIIVAVLPETPDNRSWQLALALRRRSV
jgi:hypothetical protein